MSTKEEALEALELILMGYLRFNQDYEDMLEKSKIIRDYINQREPVRPPFMDQADEALLMAGDKP